MNILFKGFKIKSLIITLLIMSVFILFFWQIKDVNEYTDYLFLVDLDNDAIPEMIKLKRFYIGNYKLYIYKNNKKNDYKFHKIIKNTNLNNIMYIDFKNDFNKDNINDLLYLTRNKYNYTIRIISGKDILKGDLNVILNVILSSKLNIYLEIEIGDFNSDSYKDILVYNRDKIIILYNKINNFNLVELNNFKNIFKIYLLNDTLFIYKKNTIIKYSLSNKKIQEMKNEKLFHTYFAVNNNKVQILSISRNYNEYYLFEIRNNNLKEIDNKKIKGKIINLICKDGSCFAVYKEESNYFAYRITFNKNDTIEIIKKEYDFKKFNKISKMKIIDNNLMILSSIRENHLIYYIDFMNKDSMALNFKNIWNIRDYFYKDINNDNKKELIIVYSEMRGRNILELLFIKESFVYEDICIKIYKFEIE